MRSHVCTRLAKGAGEKKSGCSTYRFRHNCQQTEDCQFQTQAERMLHTDPPSHAGHCKTTNVSRFESDVNSCTCLHASPQGKPRMCACLLGMLERRGIYPHGDRCLEHEDMMEEQDAQTQTVVCGSFQSAVQQRAWEAPGYCKVRGLICFTCAFKHAHKNTHTHSAQQVASCIVCATARGHPKLHHHFQKQKR